jgi:hypothetical protein
MSDSNDGARPYIRLDTLAEVLAAIILSVAALLTSWASFQAALWDGEQAAAYTRAGAARVEASTLATRNGQREGVDLILFTQWLDAYARGDARLQDFYRKRFQPDFARAFDLWLALRPQENPGAPSSPFAMPQYRPRLAAVARETDARADALFEKGQKANDISDAFVQATVILALALFLGGIGQTFHGRRTRIALSAMAAVACILGLLRLSMLPALSLGG